MDNDRRIQIEILAQRANIANGFPMEDDEKALEIIGQTWGAVLEPIPTRWLDRCFTVAAQDSAGERAKIIPASLLRAWDRIAQDGTVVLLGRGDTEDCPNKCVSGWVVRIEGQKEGVVPCPIHRTV